MNELLRRLLTAHAENGVEGLRQVLAGFTDDLPRDLDGARNAAVAAFRELEAKNTLSGDDVTRMEVLADVGEAIAEQINTQRDQGERVQELAARLGTGPTDGEQTTTPATEQTPPQVEGTAPAGTDSPQGGEVLEGELVTVSAARPPAGRAPMINLGAMANSTIPQSQIGADTAITYAVSVAADIPGIIPGTEFAGLQDLGDALVKRVTALARMSAGDGSVRAGSRRCTATRPRSSPPIPRRLRRDRAGGQRAASAGRVAGRGGKLHVVRRIRGAV
ncbi:MULTISPECIES: hypothetical protein [Actinomadura]|uniref:Uncharacterized protein n=1 Tax=Actinomadura yumaensis TaxID=111807 RepID=A0ABW2CIG0_9ACTN|nr:hypothetical protein [Actinomadura sp. J1-007]MWK37185.1 hypothetical protein [Actinomadura sp. J1-007]